jgi:hypothetical protein
MWHIIREKFPHNNHNILSKNVNKSYVRVYINALSEFTPGYLQNFADGLLQVEIFQSDILFFWHDHNRHANIFLCSYF